MNQAWQVREYERQELLRKLFREIEEEEERNSEEFLFELAQALVRYLLYLKEVKETGKSSFDCSRPPACFVSEHLAPEVAKFKRVPEEAIVLFASLLKKVAETLTSQFYADLSGVESREPQTVFHAPSAMADV